MNDTPNHDKRPSADHAPTAPTTRLHLPIQGGAIERRTGFYRPYLQFSGEYAVVDDAGEPTGGTGQFLDEPLPGRGFGSDVGDPGPSADRDARGWTCPPDGPCTWDGIV